MKIVLFGAGGQLGRTFTVVTQSQEIKVSSYPRDKADITNRKIIFSILERENPDYVVNAAAYTAVDKAEAEQERAFLINEVGVKNIAEACKKYNATLIHISTDYMFDGENSAAYIENDKPNPINVYGLSKWKGEEAVRQALDQHIILRVSWVFGLYGNNFVKTMLKLGSEREALNIVSDQIGCPTSTENISNVILEIIDHLETKSNKPFGTYHYCDSPVTNWHAFAKKIFSEAEKYQPLKIKQVNAIKTVDYPTPAKRPMNSQLNCELIKSTFDIEQRSWEKSLNKLVKELIEQ